MGTRSIQVERRIEGTPQDAFGYFTDPALHVRWLGVRAELDPRPGGAYVVHFNDRTRIKGKFVVVDRPRRLVLTWGWESEDQFPGATRELPASSTTVEVVFTSDGDETLIRLRHSGLPSDEAGEFTTLGWGMYLDRLQILAAAGVPGADPVEAALRDEQMEGTR